jgi:hypothetical protein
MLLLELARGPDTEVVGEGPGDLPGGGVAPPADAAIMFPTKDREFLTASRWPLPVLSLAGGGS